MFDFVTRFKFSFVIFFVVGMCVSAYAQVSDVITGVRSFEAKENEELVVTAELSQAVSLQKVVFFYKPFNTSEYKEIEMSVTGRSLEAIIPESEVQPPYIEYYIAVYMANNTIQNYPVNAPDANAPARIVVQPKSLKDKEIIILSPEKNKTVGQSEFFVSISLLRASASVNKAATKVFIDGVDISGSALFADDMILFNGDNFPQQFGKGKHELKVVLYDFTNTEYYSTRSMFSIITDEEAESEQNKFAYTGNAATETRNETKGGNTTWFNNLNVQLNGNYKEWDMSLETYVSSEEKEYLQPVNRYKFEIKSSWLEFAAGDHSPKYPNLIMSGKRVRGLTGAVNLGFFNIQATFGEINRAVEGKYIRLFKFSADSNSAYNYIDIDSMKYGYNKAELSTFGTYKRNIVVIRPSFGKGENFQLGLTYLHAKDDIKSIDFGSRPQENLVVGTDMFVGFWEQRIQFTGQAAVSVQNTDISKGNFTDAQLDTFLTSLDYNRDDIENWIDYKNKFSKYITINQYLSPLNPEELPTLAAEVATTLNLNQIGNYFKASYIYHGGDYNSFGNTFLRTNVRGFNVVERQRLLENTLFLSAAYERLTDNLQKTYKATTTFQTINTSVSYYPRFDFPSLIVSYTKNINENDLLDTDASKINSNLNRVTVSAMYDFTVIKKHQVSLSFTTANKDDKNVVNNFDSKSSNVNFNSTTNWSDVLTSNFNVIVNRSDINNTPTTSTTLNYISLNMGGSYYLLSNNLKIEGALTPSFGDFKRFGIESKAQYKVLNNFYVSGLLNFYFNSEIAGFKGVKKNDYSFGISTQYTL